MKFLLSWIGEFVDPGAPAADLARRLTSAGLPVETVTPVGEGDSLLDIEVFPNRPDCMNVYGVARELAAATGRALCPYPGRAAESAGAPSAGSLATVHIDEPALCGRYAARIVRGVTIGPGPSWMARRLEALGLRPVNNVVDATNYVLWEFGHPLHAFDFETLAGRQIRVRRARRGEALQTLDGTARSLEPEMLVIADAERPVALAGVMGGMGTMVTPSTTTLLIESARFDPVSVRRTARRLGLSTDASYRFERGADIEAVPVALDRAASLIQQVAGGEICPGIVESRPSPPATRRLSLRAARVELLLGAPIEPAVIESKLSALGFSVQKAGPHGAPARFEVAVPSHRQDVDREVDLVEEVARSVGYETIPERIPNIAGSGGINRAGHRRESEMRRVLSGAGVAEASTFSFSSPDLDWGLRQRLSPDEPAIEPIVIANPIAIGQEILRSTLLAGLLQSVAHNLNRGRRDVRLFEIGRTFRRGRPTPAGHSERKRHPAGPAEETLMLGIALSGRARPGHWMEPEREVSFFDMKGLVLALLQGAGLEGDLEPLASSEALDSSRAAILLAGEPGRQRRVGRLGALTPSWREKLDLRHEVIVAELSLSEIFCLPSSVIEARPLPRFPSVSRDLSLVVPHGQAYAEVERAIRSVAPDRIVRVSVFDRFTGSALPAGSMGLSIHVVYQHPDRTLGSEEIASLQETIVGELAGRFGIRLRE